MKSKSGNSLRSVLAHIVLIVLSFMCLFFFYILIINNPFSCGAAKGVFGIAGHPSAGKFKECGK